MNNYNQLLLKIDGFIRKYYLNKVIRGSIWLAGVFTLSYLFIVITEYYSYFGITTRSILFYSFIILQLALAWFLIIRHLVNYMRLGRIIGYERASEIIGNHFPEIKDKLLNTLQLKKQSGEHPNHNALINASIEQRILALAPIPFVSAIKISDNKKYLRYALLPFASMIIIAFAAPSILTDGTERFINHNQFFKKKAPFEINILNKSLVALQGDNFDLNIKLTGDEIPSEMFLEDGMNMFKLDKKNIISFNYQFKNIQQNKKFKLIGGEFSTEEFEIVVKKKPTMLGTSVELIYPHYLNKENKKIKNPSDLSIPTGTIVKWSFTTAHVAAIDFILDHNKVSLQPIQDNKYAYQERILKSKVYRVFLQNDDHTSSDSLSYQIQVTSDEFPKIDLTERPDSANVSVVYFIGKASDDHGLSALNFHYEVVKSEDENRKGKAYKVPIVFDRGKNETDFFYLWQLKALGIKPGEEISYYFDVADNDGVMGPKHMRSTIGVYKLASVEEAIKNIDKNTLVVKQKMLNAIKKAEKIQQATKKLSQDLIDQKSLGYEQKKQAEQLIDKQKKLEDLIKEIQNESKQNLFERKELNQKDEKLLDKQKEIQDLFNNVLDEKTKKLLENIQKLLDENKKDLTQEQLQKLQTDNKSLEKELDRILALYKKLEVEQKLNDAIEKLDDLAKKEALLSNESADKNNNIKDSQQKQNIIEKEFSELKKDLKETERKNELLEEPTDFKNPEEDQKNIQEKLDEAEENLKQDKAQKAAPSQKSAADKMQQMAQKLRQMQQNGEEEETKVNQQELRQILQNLLKSSFDQEKVITDLKKTTVDDPRFVNIGQKQREIKDNLKMIEDSLFSLSKRVPQIESTVNKEIQTINQQLDDALIQLTDRKIGETTRSQQFALTAINNLALMLSEALEQLQNAMKNAQSGGKGKPKPGLAQLSQMQKELNKNMQKAREQMQQQGGQQQGQKGEKGKQEQQAGIKQLSEQMARMAQQQQMIRQALQEVNKSFNKDGQGKLGNLEKTLKEMELTETDLVNKRITQESLLRQQQIQTRLLEAETADREREQDDQKESKAAKAFAPNYKLMLQEYQKIKTKEVEQIKTVPPTLNYFYKSKLSDYFKKLNLKN